MEGSIFAQESLYIFVFWVPEFISDVKNVPQYFRIALAYEKFHDISLFVFSLFFYRQTSDAGESAVLGVITLIPP